MNKKIKKFSSSRLTFMPIKLSDSTINYLSWINDPEITNFANEKNFTVSVRDILSKVTRKTKVVFLANPNNPTGTYISKNELLVLRKKLSSRVLLVVDDTFPNWILLMRLSSS